MRHVVDAIAAQGRNGDDELLHISKRELRDLKTIGDAIGIKTTVNPKTGIHEAFNWGKMLATGAGGALGFVASGFNPLGAAAGASLASGAYTAAEGGSTTDVLMNAAISGATAYAGAGIAQGLGEAGQAAAGSGIQSFGAQGAQQSAQVASNVLPQAATGEGSSQAMGSVIGDKFVPNAASFATQQGVSTAGNTAASTTEFAPFGGDTPPTPDVTPTPTPDVTPKPQMTWGDITKGYDATSGKDLLSQYGSTALKTGVGLGTLGALPNSTSTDNTDNTEFDSGMKYKAETYVTPDGQRRTRAVPMAIGGLASYARGAEIGGGLASMAQGRYLQGPGDGMSDSIPANIDGQKPARLATGEFVVPADVVSGLGNGDSTSGAKQLHSMMDRVRMDRTGTKKQGKQINPRKLMPA